MRIGEASTSSVIVAVMTVIPGAYEHRKIMRSL